LEAAKKTGIDAARRAARRSFILRVALPAILSVVLFVLAIFLILIPAVENQMLEGKKETTQELTRSAISIVDEYYQEEVAGTLTREQAQAEAEARIEQLRWGDEGKDYFWITDMHPTMIMHPYLPELDGQDLTNYQDKAGNYLFVDMVNVVKEHGSGYVEYYWQYKDDPSRIVKKLSYVEEFSPWQWVVGTGIYLDDVEAAIGSVQRNLIYVSVAIAIAVALLLLYSLRQSLKIERRRENAEQALQESHEKYRALVEASTEGLLMILGARVAYANRPLLDMLGYSDDEVTDMIPSLLLVPEGTDERAVEAFKAGSPEGMPADFEARLRAKDGREVDALVSTTPISLGGRDGFILMVRSLTSKKALDEAVGEARQQFRTMSDALSLGVFRSTWGRKAALIEVNPAMRSILGLPVAADMGGSDWLERIADPEQRNALVSTLTRDKAVQNYHLGLKREDGSRVEVSLFAVLAEGESSQPTYVDGIIEDISKQKRNEEEREALIARLQTSLFFLREPITQAIAPALSVGMNETVARTAALMKKARATSAFVTGPDGALMGITTDFDFRERVVSAGLDPQSPIRAIMSAPVVSVQTNAPIYEALLRMQERNLNHLAVLDETGKLVGAVHLRDLARYQQSSSIIITDSVRRAQSIEGILEAHDRLPGLVKAVVDSGADTRYVNRMVSGVSDSVMQKLIAMGIEKLGPAPVPFAFLALGSEGREEQTLKTDQDNALLYDDPDPGRTKEVADYFLNLGTLVCDWLDQVGYAYCEGGIMAKNPRWNLPRAVWRQQFAHWIHNAEAQELLELNMLFDFRCVTGEQQFARDLRAWVFDQMEEYPLFYLHFAQNALLYKPPLGLFGNIQTTSSGDGPKTLGLKEAVMPIVNFARLYALRYRIDATNTLDRLAELYQRGVLSRDSYEQMVPDYETLMRIRLRRQAVALEEGREPSNLITPEELTSAEEARLKRLFALSGDLRKKISYDFLGGIAGF
jgi:PAS domain S-box-containing protein